MFLMDKLVKEYIFTEIFRDYYLNDLGKKYKSFEISINGFHYNYDIYWGDPAIIFDSKTMNTLLPLAVTTISHRENYPNPRIFLHDKLENKNEAFVVVVAHEIGHLWLHDIIGFNNPSTTYIMNETESEKWADYFSYCYFKKYRNATDYNIFSSKLRDVAILQMKIYELNNEQTADLNYYKRDSELKKLVETIKSKNNDLDQFESQMYARANITIDALGDIII